MNRIERYINDVMRNIYAPASEKEKFASDLHLHFKEGIESGESEINLINRMGDPKDVANEFMAEVSMQEANFFERLIAFIIDMNVCHFITIPLLMAIIFSPAVFSDFFTAVDLFHYLDRSHAQIHDVHLSVLGIVLLVGFFFMMLGVQILYFPILEHYYGKTLGKHLLRLRVLNESGAVPGLGATFIRRLSYYFEILTLDAIFIFFTDKKQRAFDMVAKTIVIREKHLEKTPLTYLAILALLIVPIVVFIGFILLLAGIS